MARVGRVGFLIIAAAFHLMYLYSIFDIYFVSPIVSGMRSFAVEREPGTEAPAKRLVLFVGDGLRADKAFQSFPDPSPPAGLSPEDNVPIRLAPFVRSQVLNHGTFGVSHTRVPTESRPGHVALIAGLYEDVSAVTTGWKLNPVNFDSVFNRSRHTWSWGSPDILLMFKEGAVPGRVDADTYNEEDEDYTSDATYLDTWVFDKVNDLFARAKKDPELNAKLREDKIVFFLHLLGLDTTGHSYRPYSKEYLHNLKIVDKGVEQITQLIDNFYNDGKTAYVFTADHGMSDWGSHGDGHPDNTRTPLVVWGSGVAQPKPTKEGQLTGHEDGYSSDWGFDHIQRHDVEQADVAALMAYLIGLDFPVNSVGRLPLEYINATPREKALASWANTQEVLEMYRVKETQKSRNQLKFQYFAPLTQERLAERVSEIEQQLSEGKFADSIDASAQLFTTALEGLRYLQTYDWLFLRTIVSAGYLGWIAYAITTVIDLHVLHGSSEPHRTWFSNSVFMSILIGLFSTLLYQRSSWRYYAYGVFPVFFWEEVFARRKALIAGRNILLSHVRSIGGYVMLALQSILFLGVIEALVQSYFHREIYTVCFIIAAFWPLFSGIGFVSQHRFLSGAWAVGCLLMSIFTLLPVVKVESTTAITVGGMFMFLAGLFYLIFEETFARGSGHAISTSGARTIMGAQVGMILLAVIVTRSSVISLQAKAGLPLGNQIVGWSVLVSSLILPFAHRMYPNSSYLHRLVMIYLTFSPTFVILTISYEGLFYFVFCMILATWVHLEHALYSYAKQPLSASAPTGRQQHEKAQDNGSESATTTAKTTVDGETYEYRALRVSDARVALFFFFLLQSAFFSTGNIASVSSFSLDSVYRLIPVFSPFSQGALLILKLMIPFAVISANLGILNRRLEVAPSALFMVVMTISDISTLNFFYMVRDDGSWLEIGTTISHFVIANVLCFFVAGLEFVSESFVSGVDFRKTVDSSVAAVVDHSKKMITPDGLPNGNDTPRQPQQQQQQQQHQQSGATGTTAIETDDVNPSSLQEGSDHTATAKS